MLKYQVRTLNRGQPRRRKSLFDSDSGCYSPSPSCLNSSTSGDEPSPSNRSGFSFHARSSSVSSLSSVGSSGEAQVEWGTIRVYTSSIRGDTDYKTIFVSNVTTAADLVRMVLSKFRIGQKDSKLYFLTMEVKTKREGVEVVNVLTLDNDSKPQELLSCHPKDKSRLVLQSRPGFPVRICDSALNSVSNYRSILVSEETTCAEAVNLVLQSHRLPLSHQNFVLVSFHQPTSYEYVLPPDAKIVEMVEEEHEIHIKPYGGRTRMPQTRTNGILPHRRPCILPTE